MLSINPFAELSQIIPATFLQLFVIAMVLLIIIGTGLDMLHKKNVVYFFRNALKAKKSAKKELSAGKKTAVILKTVASDIATTSELGFGKRRLAHVLGMYGTILFWIASVVLIFKYSDGVVAPSYIPIIWHVGAIMTCLGGYWFWFFLRDNRITSTICGVTSVESIEKNLAWANAEISDEFWDEISKLPFSINDPESERVFTPG